MNLSDSPLGRPRLPEGGLEGPVDFVRSIRFRPAGGTYRPRPSPYQPDAPARESSGSGRKMVGVRYCIPVEIVT